MSRENTPKPFQRPDREGWWYWSKNPTTGKWQRRKGGDTEAACWQEIIATQKESELIRLGVVDARTLEQTKQNRRPMADVLSDFERHLRGRRAGEQHVRVTLDDIRTVCGLPDPNSDREKRRKARGYKPTPCPFRCLADIEPVAFEAFLGDLIAHGLSANRRNRYRASMIELVQWAVKRGMLASNPLLVVEKLNEARDRRRQSRAITEAEFWRLIDSTMKAKRDGRSRALTYWLRGRAGLRGSEIAKLRRRHVLLGDEPALLLDAGITKNGRDAEIAIDPELADALRQHLEAIGDSAGSDPLLFPSMPTRRTFQNDLERAGIPYETAEGLCDRKSLRTSYCTHMYEAGVDLRDAMERMRHSDPRLTAKTYNRARIRNQRHAADALRRGRIAAALAEAQPLGRAGDANPAESGNNGEQPGTVLKLKEAS